MWALLRGDLEESGQLAGILGVHVNEIVEAFRRGDLERVLAIFNEKLGVGAETISDVSKEWKSMVATLEATWNNALLKSDAAKNLFNSIKYILEDITQEINTQGQFWRDIESIINAIAFAIRELYWTMKGWSLLIRDIKSFFGADTPEPKLQDKTESILDKPSPKGIQLPKSEKLAKDAITQANQALQDQISLIRETARGAQEIGDAFSKLTLARMQQEMASLGDQERERSAQVRRDLLIEQQAINEQLAALAKLRGEKAQEAQGEIAGLQARREAIGSLLEESRIQTEINLKKIDANRWAEQQVNLLLKANDAIEKQSELEGLQLELEQLKRANSQLLADYTTEDRNNRTEALQAELRRLDVMDRQAGIQAGILNVQFQQNLAATTDKDTQEKLTQEYQRQLELLQAQVDVRGGRRAVIGEQIKGVGLEERRELAETLQSGLMNAATAFIERLKEGVDDIKSLLQDLGSAFIDRFIGRMLDKMVTSLTNTIEKFMSQTFGANGSFVMGLIGALAIGVASLFNNAKAEVRSLGSEISDVSNRTTDSIRGLVIAVQNQSLPVLEIGRSLREALRGTETRLDRANKLLADIASKMGVSVGSDASFYATESLGSSAF
jgi:hypothetical protein